MRAGAKPVLIDANEFKFLHEFNGTESLNSDRVRVIVLSTFMDI